MRAQDRKILNRVRAAQVFQYIGIFLLVAGLWKGAWFAAIGGVLALAGSFTYSWLSVDAMVEEPGDDE